MLLGTQRVNERGHLEIGRCDTLDLVREFGTPLYVMDETDIRQKCQTLRAAYEKRYPNSLMLFAAKSFLNMAICRIMDEEGMGLDLSSGGEVYTAMKAEFPMERTYLHGNNKSPWELELALNSGVGRIVLDNEREMDLLQDIAASQGKVQDVLLRVTPGIKPQTHSYIQTGQIDSKFGLGISTGCAKKGLKKAMELPNLNIVGLHCHIGSNIMGLDSFEMAARMMIRFAAHLRDELGLTIQELDLGGGVGVRYQSDDQPPSPEDYAEAVITGLHDEIAKYGLPHPRLLQEPGRSIVGEAGTTLYTIGTIKDVPGIRRYVSVDGGMSDNPRPALYDAKYEAIVANKPEAACTQKVTIAGKHCECDNLIFDLMLPDIEPGDVLAVQTTGAYNYTMSSNYNRFTRPAVVLVSDGNAEVIAERETLDDLVSHDRLPERLQKSVLA
ncbi:MAG TPA: diaminopimelate decarboxylase [Armatimonadota bacterium]|nr:diaminopimelate decarboxylase [Armatimonadota bacterium]